MNEKRLLFRYSPYWGRCGTPYFYCFAVFDVWFWRQKSSNEKRMKCQDSRNSHTPLSTMRIHRSLGIFVIIFTQFPLVSQSILNRFSRNFCRHHQLISRQLPCKYDEGWWSTSKVIYEINVKFACVFSKLFILTSIHASILYRLSCNFAGTSAGITATSL